jgi:hypothetical protein
MSESNVLKCSNCKYTTIRSFNLKRHHNAKHNNVNLYKYIQTEKIEKDIPKNEKDIPKNEKDIPKNEKDIPKNEKDIPKNEKDIPYEYNVALLNKNYKKVTFNENIIECKIEHGKNKLYHCKKCNKGYNQQKYLMSHENKCNFVNNLTCPKCMISFTNKNNKNRHIKANKCKARSIIYARIPKQSINNNTNIFNNCIQNNSTQNNNCVQNHLHIHNYGNERLDYLDYEKYLEIFQKNYDIPSIMTKEIHFNKEFPENNNIQYSDCKSAFIRIDDNFLIKDLTSLVDELITEKSRLIQLFAQDNKESICNKISSEIYDQIIELLLKLVCLRKPSSQYKRQTSIIIDMIKNTKNQDIIPKE